MKKIEFKQFYIITILLICTVSLYGQNNNENAIDLEELMNGRVYEVDELLYSNLTFIHQIGNENKVSSFQLQHGQCSNYSEVEQLKLANEANLYQQGSRHRTIVYQNGIDNKADLYSVGENVKIIVWQKGDNNTLNSYIENFKSPIRSAILLQKGNTNNIDVALIGDNFQGTGDQLIRVKQYGNGHQAVISINPFSSPIEITQNSPPGVDGMKINISTSAFYLPMK